ncbi:hypothetical protein T265_10517 [Opisthorchis viverrini]|uniref:Uncharacterized protein n=1 Tax=Opisthorchis viverrini TaxID=6198 RepID=A0A074Z687_OPIVI|nr:hypothetical protein T265_10517 [Opisthorchis viverrini]KER21072.1 hypothetical protein T265_10517 [Opisthorchis viverrini]
MTFLDATLLMRLLNTLFSHPMGSVASRRYQAADSDTYQRAKVLHSMHPVVRQISGKSQNNRVWSIDTFRKFCAPQYPHPRDGNTDVMVFAQRPLWLFLYAEAPLFMYEYNPGSSVTSSILRFWPVVWHTPSEVKIVFRCAELSRDHNCLHHRIGMGRRSPRDSVNLMFHLKANCTKLANLHSFAN